MVSAYKSELLLAKGLIDGSLEIGVGYPIFSPR